MEQPNPPNARSLAQKLDAMLLKAAKMSAKSVDADSIKTATGKPILGKAERKALAVAAFKAKQTLKAVSGFTGRQIASALVADKNGVFDWKQNDAAAAIREAIDAQGELSELLHDLANKPEISGDDFEGISELALDFSRGLSPFANRIRLPCHRGILTGTVPTEMTGTVPTEMIDGKITRSAFWELAKFKHPTHQICFCTERALQTLSFLKSEEVSDE